ncbi:MFS transporter [Streptomyces roseicoloratus]|uniref:MFS transporter n=1 Tax=Streptomyces roseicoloratus TaxID=2508722 RepID=A0ABY9S0I6_9ACTN|nr:MFS transporter [Streptomyces roseicoloratus]WMX46964.1 MFS transporter [Streptomyces roseicoloratus]
MTLGRNFTKLWWSQGLSNLGDGLVLAAVPLLAVTMTRDPLLVAGLSVAQFLPWLVFTLPAGALADRIDRRLIMVAGNLVRAVGFGLLVLTLVADVRSIAVLYLAVFLAGTAETLVDNAALTVPPRLVQRADLERANGRLFATQSAINNFIGPTAGAALFAMSAVMVFSSTAGLFALGALAAFMLPRMMPTATDTSGDKHTPGEVVRSIREGWSYFWNHRLLRRVAFISGSINLFSSATGGLLVLLVTGPLGVSASWYGLFIAIPAVGAVLGSLIAARVVPAIGGGLVTWLAALVPAASYVVLGLSGSIVLSEVVMFLAAVATALNQIVVSTLRQAVVPDGLLGRVTAGYRLIVLGAVPVGALLGGGLGRWLGPETTFVVCGVGLTAAAVVFASRVTTRALREAEETARAEASEAVA